MTTIPELLAQYADYIDRRTILECSQRDLEAAVITPEQRQRIAEIALELAPAYETVDAKIAELQEHIKAATLQQGETAKSDRFLAVYNGGRVSWDTKGLDGYAVAHPEILVFRSVGAPSITLRRK
jgi:hypothetical protein